MHAYKAHLAIKHERSGTNFDICAFRLHQLTNDFAKLVCVGQLPGGSGRRERRVWARRRGDAIRRIHFMEAPTKRSHLLGALKTGREKQHTFKWRSIFWAIVKEAEPQIWICRCYFPPPVVQEFMTVPRASLESGSSERVHQFGLFSVGYNNDSPPPSTSFTSLFSLMFYSYRWFGEMIHHFHPNQNKHTYVCLFNMGCCGDRRRCTQDLSGRK